MRTIADARVFDRIRTKIHLILPDRAEVWQLTRVRTSSGSYTEEKGEPLTYNGLPYIPCRLDVSKHYRNEAILEQEATVNDFELHYPFDAVIPADHTITIRGKDYEVRKLLDDNSYVITKVALISRVDVGAQ